jgi:DNA methylase
MKEAGLVYCHIIPVILDNTYPRQFPRGIVYKHKPLLWCIKGTREQNSDHISDVIYSRKPTKEDIDWQQSSVEAEHVIARLTRANGNGGKDKDIVFDPMMGSGTTGTAAIKLSRKFIGIDKDLKTFQIAKTNIGKFASSGFGLSSSLASELTSILNPIAGKEWRN